MSYFADQFLNDVFRCNNDNNVDKKDINIKNRMKTHIARSKKFNKEDFIKALACDYIKISKEL